jgi:hypothetical protein
LWDSCIKWTNKLAYEILASNEQTN